MICRLCSPDRADAPIGWEAPAPAAQPVLPLRLYVPELEEIRVSPVVARKGLLNVLEHGGSGWKKRWVVSTKYTFYGHYLLLLTDACVVVGCTPPLRFYIQIGKGSCGTRCLKSWYRSSRVQ